LAILSSCINSEKADIHVQYLLLKADKKTQHINTRKGVVMNEERYKLVNASYMMPLELRKWDASCFPRLECKLETILKYRYGKKFKKIFRSHLKPRKLEANNLK